MRGNFFKKMLIGMVFTGILGASFSLIAFEQQEQLAQQGQASISKHTMLILGKLYLKPTGNPEVAEKLLMEKLLPAAKEIQGLKITALKKMTQPGPKSDQKTSLPIQPDYIMMAEMTDMSAFMKLMASTPGSLREYGEQMKLEAGAPEFELYQILGSSEEKE